MTQTIEWESVVRFEGDEEPYKDRDTRWKELSDEQFIALCMVSVESESRIDNSMGDYPDQGCFVGDRIIVATLRSERDGPMLSVERVLDYIAENGEWLEELEDQHPELERLIRGCERRIVAHKRRKGKSMG
jgi:hypothetical protein